VASFFGTLSCRPGAPGNRSSGAVLATLLSVGEYLRARALPGPGTVLLLAAGLVGLAARRRLA